MTVRAEVSHGVPAVGAPDDAAVEPYARAWTVPNPDGGEGAVLVACGRDKDPYWWVLCPATATLYLSSDDQVGLDCNYGDECDFDELHAAVHKVYRRIVGLDA